MLVSFRCLCLTKFEKRGRFSLPIEKFVALLICGFSQPLCDGMRKSFAFSVPFGRLMLYSCSFGDFDCLALL